MAGAGARPGRVAGLLLALLCAALSVQAVPLYFGHQTGRVDGRLRVRLDTAGHYDRQNAIVTVRATEGRGALDCIVFKTSGEKKVILARDSLTLHGGVMTRTLEQLKGWRIGVELRGKVKGRSVKYEVFLRRPNWGKRRPVSGDYRKTQNVVCGLADLHNHHVSALAYGGNRFQGNYEGLVAPHILEPHFRRNVKLVQRMHEVDLLKAHAQGLNVMIAAVSNDANLCLQTPDLPCNDMDTAVRQVRAIRLFEETHRHFYQVAHDSMQARRIVGEGKLAVIIGVEVSNLFPLERGDWKEQLWELYDMGVRSLQVVHQYNSRFSGAAPHRLEKSPDAWYSNGFHFDIDPNTHENRMGLTDTGVALLEEARRLGMIIDVAHMSRAALRDFDAHLQKSNSSWSIVHSHCSFQELMPNATRERLNEFACDRQTIDFIKRHKGLIGLHTGMLPAKSFIPSKPEDPRAVPNDCAGSSKSLAQQIQYARSLHVQTGLATSMNGWSLMTGPRFGEFACPANDGNASKAVVQTHQVLSAFDDQGLAAIDLLPDLVRDLVNVGAFTGDIEESAERLLRVWDRVLPTFDNAIPRPAPRHTKGARLMICEDFSRAGQLAHSTHNGARLREVFRREEMEAKAEELSS